MAQDFAVKLYHSATWRRVASSYMKTFVDLSGHTLVEHGGRYCWTDDDGNEVYVNGTDVVPPGLCERCFLHGEYTPAKLVHHKHHLTPENINDPEVAFGFDNLQRLCQDCHAIVHSGQPEPRVSFNDDGSVKSFNDNFRAMVMQLTETTDERRNIHSSHAR